MLHQAGSNQIDLNASKREQRHCLYSLLKDLRLRIVLWYPFVHIPSFQKTDWYCSRIEYLQGKKSSSSYLCKLIFTNCYAPCFLPIRKSRQSFNALFFLQNASMRL